MTFTISSDVAAQLLRRVPTRMRSRYVADALREKLSGHDLDLVRACQMANQNADVQAIEKEFDSLASPIAEPWNEKPVNSLRKSKRASARRRVVG